MVQQLRDHVIDDDISRMVPITAEPVIHQYGVVVHSRDVLVLLYCPAQSSAKMGETKQ